MKKELIRYAFILLVLIFIAVFIYPTLYTYRDYINGTPVKINRVTGEAWLLEYGEGWVNIIIDK